MGWYLDLGTSAHSVRRYQNTQRPTDSRTMPKRARTGRDSRGHMVWRRAGVYHKKASGRKARNALVKVPRNKLGFPQEMATTLRYVTTFPLEPNSSSAAGISILANGLYDPEVPVGGHQPRGFDQYMEQYQKFTVSSSKIAVTFAFSGYLGPPPGVTGSTGAPLQQMEDTGANVVARPSVICLVHKAVAANATGTINNFQEQDRTRWVTIVPQGEAKTVRASLSCKEFFGKDFLIGSDGYTGTDSSDPDNLLYYHVMAGRNDDGAAGKVPVVANIMVEYKVTFTEPKQLIPS